jgi:hypothetical protein
MNTRRTASKAAAESTTTAVEAVQALVTPNPLLEDWTGVGKAQLDCAIAMAQAVLRGAESLREMQRDTAIRAQKWHEEIAAELPTVRDHDELMRLQVKLVQNNVDHALRYWLAFFEITQQARTEATNLAMKGFTDIANAFLASSQSLTTKSLQAAPATPEAGLTELARQWTGGPVTWPAQEAAQEAMTWATTAWNEWMSQARRWQQGFEQGEGGHRSLH